MKKQVHWIIEGEAFYEFTLPEPCTEFSIGRCETDDIIVMNCPHGSSVRFIKNHEDVEISCSHGIFALSNGNREVCLSIAEDAIVEFVDSTGSRCFLVKASFIDYGKTQNYDRCIELATNHILFGSGNNCQVCFPLTNGHDIAFEITQGSRGISLTAHKPLFGVYINNKKIAPEETSYLKNGDFIFVENVQFVIKDGFVLCSSDIEVLGLPYTDSFEQNSHLEYPRMNRTSRYHDVPPSDSVEILDPPALPEKESRNIFLSILPTIIMAVLIVFMRGSFSSTGGMMLFSVLSMTVGAAGSVFTYLENKKAYQKKKIEREDGYKKYILSRRNEIRELRKKEKEIMTHLYISPRKEIENIEEFSADLFDRTQSDQDFLDIRLGYGLIPSGQPIKCKKHEVFEQTDELFSIPSMIAEEFAFNDDLPAVVHAREANAIGFQGTFYSLQNILNQTVLDLVTRHHPQDVSLYFFCGPEFESQVTSYRLLPHVWDDYAQRRNIAYNMGSRDILLEKVYKKLALRDSNRQALDNMPWMIIFVYSDDEIMHHPITKYIDNAAQLHAVFIFLAQYREQLPLGCKYTVKLFSNENGGQLIDMYNKEDDRVFHFDLIETEKMDTLARRLAPIYSGEINLSAMLVQSLSFFEMLGTTAIEENRIRMNWEKADPRESLAAPLGVVAGGETLYLDIHEKIHGPHGLVAGTTGSGKSELLISYVLSMAYHFSPEDVTFVIIDFKGSGLAGPLTGLPHVIGTITNLDKHEIDRSLMSIRAESIRRQRMFAENGEGKIKNINDYMTAFRNGEVEIPLPHLVIIVDEFAELKAQHPEFMDELISTSRIGRSLGIHLILATQKPSGVVNEQIWSNSDFKVCLRVQTQEDSNEVLKSPLAAEIREPGRAYLQVGRSEIFTLFQSGYSGAIAEEQTDYGTPFQLDKLSLSGEPEVLYEKNRRKSSDVNATQLGVIKEKIKCVFDESKIKEPDMLCLPPLNLVENYPENTLPGKYKLPIGIFDHPAMQMQGLAICDLLDGNILVVGTSQSGKTNLLQTILRATAESLTAKEINVYLMDFNTGVFKTMESLSIVGSVILMEQRERVKNLFKLLLQDIEVRKERLIDASVTSFRAYQDTGRSDMPAVLVMIDNFAVFEDLYGEEYEEDLITLLRDGQSVGIIFCITATQPSLVGMRRLCYFGQRIALHMQDRGDVPMVLDGCRKYAPEIPGRAIWKHDKEYLDMQVFLAYQGSTEQERINTSNQFIKQHIGDYQAQIVPEVPMVLTHAILRKMFTHTVDPQMFVYGMSYENVEPVSIDMFRQFEIALVGKNIQGKNRFLELLIQHLKNIADARLHIVDHYDRPLMSYADLEYVCEYTLDVDRIIEIVNNEYDELIKRLEDAREHGSGVLKKYPLDVFIINSWDAIIRLSDDGVTMDRYTELLSRCKQMKALFVFADIENRHVNYNSPALLRSIVETPQALLFESLSSGRMFDFDAFVIRENKNPLGRDDAFRIDDSSVDRVKMIWN